MEKGERLEIYLTRVPIREGLGNTAGLIFGCFMKWFSNQRHRRRSQIFTHLRSFSQDVVYFLEKREFLMCSECTLPQKHILKPIFVFKETFEDLCAIKKVMQNSVQEYR